MRIATLATGGIGGFLAVHLLQAGHEVFCVARGAHLDAIRAEGLHLNRPEGNLTAHPALTTDNTAEVGPVDAVLFGVKGNALPDAARDCRNMIGPETVVVPFLNGVEAADRLQEFLPGESVANGVAYVSTTISAPGTITQTGTFSRFVFAERDNRASPRIDTLRAAIRSTGQDAPDVDDIDREVWSKFVLFGALSGVTSAARCTVGDIKSTPELSRLMQDGIAETAELARALGINLPEGLEAKIWSGLQKLPSSMRASTAIDLEAGRELETRWLNGAVVRLAEKAGVDVPTHRALLAVLTPFIEGRSVAG